MTAPKFYPAALEGYTLSATSTQAAYPLANLQTYFAADLWKSDALTANQSLVINFGAPRSINFIVIQAHNFEAVLADVGIRLQAADDSGFTVNLATIISVGLNASTDPHIVEFDPLTKQYWRLYFESVGALAAKPELGNLFLGTSLAFETTYEFGYRAVSPSYATSEGVALNGAIRTSQAVLGRRLWDLRFRLQDATFQAAWETFHATVRGKLRPFYFLETDGTSLYYVHLDSDYNAPSPQMYGRADLDIRLKAQLADV